MQYVSCVHNKAISMRIDTADLHSIIKAEPLTPTHTAQHRCSHLVSKNCNCPSDYYKDKASKLGPDPLRQDADPERLWEKVRVSKKPVGGILMDQTAVAGIGNIYRAEILFKVCIS